MCSFSTMLILSSCSSTKRATIDPQLTVGGIRARRLLPFAQEWVQRLATAPSIACAGDLYGGPGVTSALAAARRLKCPAYFVSAGLSLVPSRRRVPSYDLSVSHFSSAPPAVANGDASPSDWWKALNDVLGKHQPIASLVKRSKGPVLAALPDSYVRMVAHEFLTLSEHQKSKLRIIVAANTRVPKELEGCVVRYDDRLAGVANAPRGANSYFPQRALGHFALLLATNPGKDADITAHRRWVEAALANAKPVVAQERRRLPDAAISRWIKGADPKSTHSVSWLLRRFRDAGLACEQGRFRTLVEQTRSNLECR